MRLIAAVALTLGLVWPASAISPFEKSQQPPPPSERQPPKSEPRRPSQTNGESNALYPESATSKPASGSLNAMEESANTDRGQDAHEGNKFGEFVAKTISDPIALYTLVLTVSTIVLAAYTARLWSTTNKLRIAGEDTTKRQLRAYVFADLPKQSEIPGTYGQYTRALVTTRNAGQTPAYRVAYKFKTTFHCLPLQDELSVSLSGDEPCTVLNPSASIKQDLEPEQTMTEEQKTGFGRGDVAIFTYGEIRYVDAFGYNRVSRFRCIRRTEWAEWEWCSEGNETEESAGLSQPP
jgi:hypothetical protein